MAVNHLEQVLTSAGLPADQVKSLVDLPADAADFKADTFVAPLHTVIETKVKNDPKFYEGLNKESLPKEFLKQLEQEQYGRSATIVRTNLLKAVGMKEEDFKELGDEGKKLEIFTPAFAKKLSEGKVGSAELQQKLIEANTKIQELELKTPELETKYKTEAEKKVAEMGFDFVVLATLAQIPNLKVSPKIFADKAAAALKAKYGYVLNGTDAELRQKDDVKLKVLTDNGTKELTLARALTEWVTAEGLVNETNPKTGGKTGTTQVEVNPEGGGLKINTHVNDKIKQRIEADKKAAGTTT